MKPVQSRQSRSFHSSDFTFRPTVMADAIIEACLSFGLVGVRRNSPMVREAKIAVNGVPFHVAPQGRDVSAQEVRHG